MTGLEIGMNASSSSFSSVVSVVAVGKCMGVGCLCDVYDGSRTSVDDGWFGATGGVEVEEQEEE